MVMGHNFEYLLHHLLYANSSGFAKNIVYEGTTDIVREVGTRNSVFPGVPKDALLLKDVQTSD